jgi:S-adenosylmethionine-dependent methyltransferase
MPADRSELRTEHQSGQSATRPSAARTAVVWDALREVLGTDQRTSVVDFGGGTGGFAVRAAELGHRVTVIDPNPDALAILERRARESEVADLVTGHQGDLDTVLDLAPAGSADVLLCHGVLEIVEDPAAALRTLAQVVRGGGVLSLLVNQRHAAVVARAMAGHFGQARTLLDPPPSAPRRFTAEEVATLLGHAGFDTTALHAVRVFADLVPSSLVELEPGSAAALVELEKAVATRPEYLPLATQLHALATRR